MRDSYVGDIGDFANNGLLRHLCGMTGEPIPPDGQRLRLGVVWYINAIEAPISNGQTIGYLVGTQGNLNQSQGEIYICGAMKIGLVTTVKLFSVLGGRFRTAA